MCCTNREHCSVLNSFRYLKRQTALRVASAATAAGGRPWDSWAGAGPRGPRAMRPQARPPLPSPDGPRLPLPILSPGAFPGPQARSPRPHAQPPFLPQTGPPNVRRDTGNPGAPRAPNPAAIPDPRPSRTPGAASHPGSQARSPTLLRVQMATAPRPQHRRVPRIPGIVRRSQAGSPHPGQAPHPRPHEQLSLRFQMI